MVLEKSNLIYFLETQAKDFKQYSNERACYLEILDFARDMADNQFAEYSFKALDKFYKDSDPFA